MQRALIGILVLFSIGIGYGALSSGAPHDYDSDKYRAESLRAETLPTTLPTPQEKKSVEDVKLPRTPEIPAEVPPKEKTTESPALTSHTFVARSESTVLDAMKTEASAGFTFTSKSYPALGVFIESIGGLTPAEGMYWILYINGATSTLGASQARVQTGDVVTWRYERGY